MQWESKNLLVCVYNIKNLDVVQHSTWQRGNQRNLQCGVHGEIAIRTSKVGHGGWQQILHDSLTWLVITGAGDPH